MEVNGESQSCEQEISVEADGVDDGLVAGARKLFNDIVNCIFPLLSLVVNLIRQSDRSKEERKRIRLNREGLRTRRARERARRAPPDASSVLSTTSMLKMWTGRSNLDSRPFRISTTLSMTCSSKVKMMSKRLSAFANLSGFGLTMASLSSIAIRRFCVYLSEENGQRRRLQK